MTTNVPLGTVLRGNSIKLLEAGFLPENSVHAVVTDPPYGLSFMDEDWDKFRRKDNEADVGRDDVGGRLSARAPASGAESDSLAYQAACRRWAEAILPVLKPGGHLIAFSGNRTHHRLMVGVEDAGFEVRDTITWHYGEGFPKGAKLETYLDGEEAEMWGDWRAMLKPATEFAGLFRAPLGEDSATQNQVEHGVGNLNVEACRIPLDAGADQRQMRTMTRSGKDRDDGWHMDEGGEHDADVVEEEGRFPPNLALDPVMADVMDLESVHRQSGDIDPDHETSNSNLYGEYGGTVGPVYADGGGASRFFYCSKAAKSERTHDGNVENDHPTVKPLDLMRWLVRMVTAEGQIVLDPFAGSATTALACEAEGREWVAVELEREYVDIARDRLDHADALLAEGDQQ